MKPIKNKFVRVIFLIILLSSIIFWAGILFLLGESLNLYLTSGGKGVDPFIDIKIASNIAVGAAILIPYFLGLFLSMIFSINFLQKWLTKISYLVMGLLAFSLSAYFFYGYMPDIILVFVFFYFIGLGFCFKSFIKIYSKS